MQFVATALPLHTCMTSILSSLMILQQQHLLSTALFAFVPLIKIAYFPFEKALNVYERLEIHFSCSSWGVFLQTKVSKNSQWTFTPQVSDIFQPFSLPCMHNFLFLNVTKKFIIIVDNFRGLFFLPHSLALVLSFQVDCIH